MIVSKKVDLVTICGQGQTIANSAHAAYWLRSTEGSTPAIEMQEAYIVSAIEQIAQLLGYKLVKIE